MAKKRTHQRVKPRSQPERPIGNRIFIRCLEFLEANDGYSMDDSYDRRALAEKLEKFISENIVVPDGYECPICESVYHHIQDCEHHI